MERIKSFYISTIDSASNDLRYWLARMLVDTAPPVIDVASSRSYLSHCLEYENVGFDEALYHDNHFDAIFEDNDDQSIQHCTVLTTRKDQLEHFRLWSTLVVYRSNFNTRIFLGVSKDNWMRIRPNYLSKV